MSEIKPLNILIVDTGCKFHGGGSTLNHALSQHAAELLKGFGHKVTVTEVDRDFDPDEEAIKFDEADSIIVQFPGGWMSYPWQLKRYIDEVFMCPAINPNDGRSRHDHTRLYGTGGTLTGKTYMLSTKRSQSPCSSLKAGALMAFSSPCTKHSNLSECAPSRPLSSMTSLRIQRLPTTLSVLMNTSHASMELN